MCSSTEYSNVNTESNIPDNAKRKIKIDVCSERSLASSFHQPTHPPSDNVVSHQDMQASNSSPRDSLYSMSCDSADEPLDLCTEKVKKIKTSHIIDHFVSKFLGDSLCANPDRTRKSSIKDFPNNIQSGNFLVQNKLNSFLVNGQVSHRVPSESFVQNNCPPFMSQAVHAKEYNGQSSETNSSKYSRQISGGSNFEPTDFEISEFRVKSSSNQLSPRSRLNANQKLKADEEHQAVETSSHDSNGSSFSEKLGHDSEDQLKLPIKRRNYSDSSSSTSDEPPAKRELTNKTKQKTAEQATIVVGASVVSQLLSGFREAPNSKACDLFSKAIHSVIDNAYDNNQEADQKTKKLSVDGNCEKSEPSFNNSEYNKHAKCNSSEACDPAKPSDPKCGTNIGPHSQTTCDDGSSNSISTDVRLEDGDGPASPPKELEIDVKNHGKESEPSATNRARKGDSCRRKSPRVTKGKRYQVRILYLYFNVN